MMIQVVKPGLLSIFQDTGRYGYQKYGVIVGGAMDDIAHRVANILVGNEESEATLEMAVVGPTLYFEKATLIAICGATFRPVLDGVELPLWRPILIKAKQTVHFGEVHNGMRAYLAVAGGFNLKAVLGSRSTYLRAQIGGLAGRALVTDDRLQMKSPTILNERLKRKLLQETRTDPGFITVPWQVSRELIPQYSKHPTLRVLPGNQFEQFDDGSLEVLLTEPFFVQSQSDRMGYRLSGTALQLKEPMELLSEPVTVGTVQVPADGNPIVLMADRQTTGGYPKALQVISADLPLLAQAQIGSEIRFELINMEEAQRKIIVYVLALLQLQQTIKIYSF